MFNSKALTVRLKYLICLHSLPPCHTLDSGLVRGQSLISNNLLIVMFEKNEEYWVPSLEAKIQK